MTLIVVAWECVTPETVINCFKKAGISLGAQVQSQLDEDDPFKLLATQMDDFRNNCYDNDESSIDFTVSTYVDADEDVQTFEIDSMTDQEIIDRVRAVDDENDEDDDIEEIDQNERITEPPIKSEVRRAIETLQRCCLFQDDGEKMRKKVTEIEKICEISLLQKKQQSLITNFFRK